MLEHDELRAALVEAAREGAREALRQWIAEGRMPPSLTPPPHPEAEDAAPDGLLCVQGVAKRLSVSARTVERLVAAGELHPIRVGGQRRFHPETVDAYVRHAAKTSTRARRAIRAKTGARR